MALVVSEIAENAPVRCAIPCLAPSGRIFTFICQRQLVNVHGMNDGQTNRSKILILLAVAVIAVIASVFWGRPVYRHFKERRSAAEAQAFLARGDFRNAVLSARLALLLNSNNLPACLVMAGVAEAAHSPATLDWCQRVVQLSPALTNQLRLAAAGLRYQSPPYPLTTQVLADLAPTADASPEFHIVSAQLALSLHRLPEAESHFAAASRLEPSNQLFQLNLAVLRLSSTNPAVVETARGTLRQFSTDTNLGPVALRSLVADRLLHDDAAGAQGYATQLLAGAQANLGDRLQYLGILKKLQSPELAAQLNAVQHESATNATLAAQTAGWMEANGFMPEAIAWLDALPGPVQNQPPVRLAQVDYYLGTTNWTGLRTFAANGDWGEVEFLRLASVALAWSKLGDPLVADGNWRAAMDAAENRLGALNAMLEFSARWGLSSEQEAVLLRIIREFPDAAWAQHGLEEFYLHTGDTAKLYALYAGQFLRFPASGEIKNNLAATALLLRTNLPQAFRWAAEIYAQQTNDPVIISTYAFAQHVQGHDGAGLAAFQALTPAQLEQPSVALYYGLLLSASGKPTEAAPYLEIARKHGQLLPEERQLLRAAGN